MTGDPLEEGKQQLLLSQGPADLLDPLCLTKSHLVVEPSVQPVRVVLHPPALLLTPLPHLRKVVINPGGRWSQGFYYSVGVKEPLVQLNIGMELVTV